MQYVGGYILHSLMKEKKNSGIFPLIEKLCSDDEPKYGGTLVGTSCQWIDSVDRGSLTHITDEAFQCFMKSKLSVGNTCEQTVPGK